jgi:hypothetical protein
MADRSHLDGARALEREIAAMPSAGQVVDALVASIGT